MSSSQQSRRLQWAVLRATAAPAGALTAPGELPFVVDTRGGRRPLPGPVGRRAGSLDGTSWPGPRPADQLIRGPGGTDQLIRGPGWTDQLIRGPGGTD